MGKYPEGNSFFEKLYSMQSLPTWLSPTTEILIGFYSTINILLHKSYTKQGIIFFNILASSYQEMGI